MSTVRPDNPVTEDEVANGDLVSGPPTTRGASSLKSWAAQNYRQAILFGTFALMILIFSLAKPSTFLTATNIHNLVNAMPVLTMMAIAVTIVLVLGEFDLSVPNVASLAAVVIGVLATQTSYGLIVALVVGAVIVGLAAGAVNGTAVGY